MTLDRGNRFTTWLAVVTALVSAVVLGIPLRSELVARRRHQLRQEILQRAPDRFPPDPYSRAIPIRERQGWTPQDFFSTPEAIQASDWITNDELSKLQAAIDKGLDVNLTGVEGITLLHWAYIDDDLPAFQLLLAAGASPDRTLTRERKLTALSMSLGNWDLIYGDSLLFTLIRSERRSKWEYFMPALKACRNTNQRNWANDTLLLACSKTETQSSVSGEVLQGLIDAGVDLNAQDEDGYAAAHRFAERRPDLALQLLKAGASPNLTTNRERKVATMLASGGKGVPLDKKTIELKSWLEDYEQKQVRP